MSYVSSRLTSSVELVITPWTLQGRALPQLEAQDEYRKGHARLKP